MYDYKEKDEGRTERNTKKERDGDTDGMSERSRRWRELGGERHKEREGEYRENYQIDIKLR